MTDYTTKDSGQREEYDSGMVRDTNDGKARFDLIVPEGVPYKEQMLTRFAELMARGAQKYGDRNWEKAAGETELNRFKESAFRHFMQWMTGETDEDHASAVLFNVTCYETVKYKIDGRKEDPELERLKLKFNDEVSKRSAPVQWPTTEY